MTSHVLLDIALQSNICGTACRAFADRQAVPINDGYTSAEKAKMALACWDGSQAHNISEAGVERGIKNR